MTKPPNAIRTIAIGMHFWYDSVRWVVVGIDGAAVRLRHGDKLILLSVTELMEHADPDDTDEDALANEDPAPEISRQAHPALLSTLVGVKPSKSDLRRMEAVNLLLTGYPDGIKDDNTPPDSDYGPQNGKDQKDRIRLYAERHGIGCRTIERWLAAAQHEGLDALTDKRRAKAADPLGGCPQVLRDAMIAVVLDQSDKSRVTDAQLIHKAKRIVTASEGPDFKFPGRASLYRWIKVLKTQSDLHLSKKTQQGHALRPKVMGPPLVTSRPFEVVEIDTQDVDLLAIDSVTGLTINLSLTLAIDLFTRSLVAWRFTARQPKATDAALLLHDMLSPKTWDPEWGPLARWRYGVPETLVLPGGPSEPIAGVPVGTPSAVTLDNGKVYVSDAMKSAALRLGVSLYYARAHTPTDKPHIEAVFNTIKDQFVEWLPGFTAASVSDRGSKQNVDDKATLFISEIEQMFAKWVAVKYQNTPHTGLRVPWMPGKTFTPNEMYDLGIAMTGYIRTPTSPDIAISLLPRAARVVSDIGIEVGSLLYNSPRLDPYRKRKSPFPELKGKWPIRIDPRDISRIWFWAGDPQEPSAGTWIPVPARIRRHVGAFSDIHLAYAKSLFTDQERQSTRADQILAVERTMLEMFDRIQLHGPASKREALVMATGAERIRQAAVTFPHDPDDHGLEAEEWQVDTHEPLEDIVIDDLDDIEPFEVVGNYDFDPQEEDAAS